MDLLNWGEALKISFKVTVRERPLDTLFHIINLDDIYGPGTDWVVLLRPHKRPKEYFDPFGLTAPLEIARVPGNFWKIRINISIKILFFVDTTAYGSSKRDQGTQLESKDFFNV